jgi:hypothetical protein
MEGWKGKSMREVGGLFESREGRMIQSERMEREREKDHVRAATTA